MTHLAMTYRHKPFNRSGSLNDRQSKREQITVAAIDPTTGSTTIERVSQLG